MGCANSKPATEEPDWRAQAQVPASQSSAAGAALVKAVQDAHESHDLLRSNSYTEATQSSTANSLAVVNQLIAADAAAVAASPAASPAPVSSAFPTLSTLYPSTIGMFASTLSTPTAGESPAAGEVSAAVAEDAGEIDLEMTMTPATAPVEEETVADESSGKVEAVVAEAAPRAVQAVGEVIAAPTSVTGTEAGATIDGQWVPASEMPGVEAESYAAKEKSVFEANDAKAKAEEASEQVHRAESGGDVPAAAEPAGSTPVKASPTKSIAAMFESKSGSPQQSDSEKERKAAEAAASAIERKIAPTVDYAGKPIPDWKQKVLQGQLDKEWETAKQVAAETAAAAALPEWKRKLLEKEGKLGQVRALGASVVPHKEAPKHAVGPAKTSPVQSTVVKSPAKAAETPVTPAQEKAQAVAEASGKDNGANDATPQSEFSAANARELIKTGSAKAILSKFEQHKDTPTADEESNVARMGVKWTRDQAETEDVVPTHIEGKSKMPPPPVGQSATNTEEGMEIDGQWVPASEMPGVEAESYSSKEKNMFQEMIDKQAAEVAHDDVKSKPIKSKKKNKKKGKK